MQEQERHGDHHGIGWLRVIAIGKLIKVTVLLAVGIAALVAVKHDAPSMLVDAANVIGVDPGSRNLYRLAAKLSGIDAKKLEEIGFGSFVYAALFSVEGIGLWLQKTWGEYVTIVITSSFIPFEIYELTRHFSALKVVMIALNVLVVVYLVARVLKERRGRRSAPLRLGIASH